jgi:hypothetical protein
MSNNIYDIMKKLNAVESIDKPTQEPKNATLLESTMNQVLSEKYMGFDKVVASAKKGGARDPEAVAASIGRKKYGKEKFQKAAAAGKKLGENARLSERTWTDPETGEFHGPFSSSIRPSNQQQSNYSDTVHRDSTGKPTQTFIKRPSGGFPGLNIPSQQPYVKTDSNVINNALKQNAQEPAVKEDDMEEGNKFTGNLAKARAKGLKKADLDGDGDMETVKEEKKETKTGTIHKAKPGRYGGYNPETDPDKDEYAEKKPRGRPPKEGGESAAEKEKREKREMTAKELQRWIVGSKPADFDEKEGTGTEYTKMASAEKAVSAYNKMREKGKSHSEALKYAAEKYDISQSTLNRYIEDEKLDEVAPPGKKAERMVKHIKQGYAKDGKVTPKEKGIAYATAWKAHNAGKVEESIPPNFPRSLAKKIYEHYNGDVNSTLTTMWNIHNTVMENVAPSKKKINEGMSFEQATTKPANKPVVGTYKGGVWTADPPKKGEVGVPVPQNIDGGSAPPPTKPAKPVKSQKKAEVDTTDTGLAEMLNLAGIKNSISEAEIAECGMSPISGQYMDDAEGRMSINTNMSTDGNKSVTITADGDSAVELMKMLKMAGLHADGSEDTDIEKMSEEKDDRYEANTTPEEEVLPIQTQLKGGDGEVAGKEKKMTPHGYQFADNPIAMKESMTLKLMKEYESIKKVK